jgi:ABC-type phosphate transport system auxiliary subunit
LERLENKEESYQKMVLEKSELEHKLSVANEKIYAMQTTLEQTNSIKFDLEGRVKNLQEQIDIYL